jgi:glc operon protein GlcG
MKSPSYLGSFTPWRRCMLGALLIAAALGASAQQAAGDATPELPGEKSAAPPYGMSITLARAEKVIAAARAEALRLGSSVNAVAVVDTHGELVAFIRMDDATAHSVDYAIIKARGAARSRRMTATPPPEMALALTSMPDFVAMPGGIPLVLDGHTIGAIGVSGGEDLAIAKAALKGLH